MSTTTLHLEHRFADALPELAVDWQAETAPGPTLLALDEELAGDLGLDPAWLRTEEGLRLLTGEQPPAGARPVAQGYAGHQFGGYSPRLGDGRALLLGELTDREGRLRDLHLKGSGRTPWSRGGDGLAVVGPMLREHLVSAAMHALGVPTTRSLGVVATGRAVQREQPLPGAVLARVASSHLRVGTLQYAVALDHQQPGAGLVRRVVEHAATRHHPHVLDADVPALALLEEVTRVQAELVASWMSVGFVHGVMNTDNVTLSGETIDYGPCAFLDGFDQAAVFSSIDTGGRYAFGQQPAITQWNLARMAETLLPLVVEQAGLDQEGAVERCVAVLETFPTLYGEAYAARLAAKLGLPTGLDPEVRTALVGDPPQPPAPGRARRRRRRRPRAVRADARGGHPPLRRAPRVGDLRASRPGRRAVRDLLRDLNGVTPHEISPSARGQGEISSGLPRPHPNAPSVIEASTWRISASGSRPEWGVELMSPKAACAIARAASRERSGWRARSWSAHTSTYARWVARTSSRA